ncbi:MAG: transcriptional repressor NrdR [Firmicutes bacterium]|nr:transcriptional repressor NrdR [Bacillota bacterium]
MRCPFCGYAESKVLDTRTADDGSAIRRRRECTSCGRRFTTYEKVEEAPLWIVKRDGRREPFSRKKLLSGVEKACEKCNVSREAIEHLVDEVERDIRSTAALEIESVQIGDKVMERLRKLNDVAYVRFASVYRQFRDLDSFRREIEQLATAPSVQPGEGDRASSRPN